MIEPSSQRYCLDTSCLINGWRKHYCRSVFPTLWDKIDELIDASTIFSCDEVYRELEKQDDDLLEWAKQRRKELFEKPTELTIAEVATIMRSHPTFAAAGGSTNAADPWLIAHAKIANAVVVTDEHYADNQRPTKSPKIPNVCEELGMKWMKPVDFFEAVGIKL